MEKQYGLIVPDKSGNKKKAPTFTSTKNVFGDDNDSDEEVGVPKAPLRAGEKMKRQARLIQKKALEDDPTVYQYDELYDDIEVKKKEAKNVQKEVKKPRYIEKLLHTATLRKKENERRVERQVQKEREEEGDKYADKESFVTTAYKNKLEEIKLEEEKERREKYLEEVGDVTKQADLGGFYRHLYEQQLQPEKSTAHLKHPKEVKKEPDPSPKEKATADPAKKSKRTYRKREQSGEIKTSKNPDEDDRSGSDDEQVNRQNIKDAKENKKQRTHLESNIDADSDFSIDDESSSSGDEDGSKTEEPKSKKVKKDKSKESDPIAAVKVEDSDKFKKPNEIKSVDAKSTPDKKADVKNVENKKTDAVVVKEVKPKVDIWKKRTVGDVFDQALQRYYERKSARGC